MARPHPKALGRAIQTLAEREDITGRRMRRWVAMIALAQVLLGAKARAVIRGFAIKGGHAIELRIRRRARASRDIDVIIDVAREAGIVDTLGTALRDGWSGFTFGFRDVKQTEHAFRFSVFAHYENTEWATFDVEAMAGDVIDEDLVEPLDLATFGLERPDLIPCLDLYAQVAQKFHGATDPEENRPRDLLDIYILKRTYKFDVERLRTTVGELFMQRAKQPWPAPIELRENWEAEIAGLIDRNGFNCTVAEVLDVVRAFALDICNRSPRLGP